MEQNQVLEDIGFIRQMIENNRRSLVDNGIIYISTGVYVVIGAVLSYILESGGKGGWVAYLWLALMAILIGFNLLARLRIEKERRKKTFGSQVFNAVWTACGIPVVIVSFLFLVTHLITMNVLFACISACLGIGYYLTGVINDLGFMKVLAFGWWGSLVCSIFWGYIGQDYQLGLFFTFLVFILEVVPGIIIYRKWKRVYDA